MPAPARLPELLAPAGDAAALEAALHAGANAVYLGLRELNARRRAANFAADELAPAVAKAHAAGAKVYLTVNIALRERDLGLAARTLELARQAKVDAVLVCDPALLLLRPQFPELEFHFSTQARTASTADVLEAKSLGISRVVLARECTLAEIQAACATGVEIETFVQGALCLCISGACLLSSWGGGRSGNRGSCTSPCRVPWGIGEEAEVATPLSMMDLGLVDRLKELKQAGVASLKIEGRLKTPAWVGRAVALYREALDHDTGELYLHRAAELGEYTGRPLTDAYLDGRRGRLTGTWAREAAETEAPARGTPDGEPQEEAPAPQAAAKAEHYDLQIMKDPEGIRCSCTFRGEVHEWTQPLTEVRDAGRAITVYDLLEWLKQNPVQDCLLARCRSDVAKAPIPPRLANEVENQLSKLLHKLKKKAATQTQTEKLPLPEGVRTLLKKDLPHQANSQTLGNPPNRVRLSAAKAAAFATQVPGIPMVVEQVLAGDLPGLAKAAGAARLTIALPPVFFESDLASLKELLAQTKKLGLRIEANNWGGIRLACEAGIRFEAGPGLAVYNSLAARFLGTLGAEGVHYAAEADQGMLEDLSGACMLPATLMVYGRPPLMLSRASQPEELLGKTWKDRRDIRMAPLVENGILAYRSVEPVNLTKERNPKIAARWLAADLVSSNNPANEWKELLKGSAAKGSLFNYRRGLA